MSKRMGVCKVNPLIGYVSCHSRPFRLTGWASLLVDSKLTSGVVPTDLKCFVLCIMVVSAMVVTWPFSSQITLFQDSSLHIDTDIQSTTQWGGHERQQR